MPALILMLSNGLAATSPTTIMSKAMLAMMDTLGDLAHQFKGSSRWKFGTGTYPGYGWQGIDGYPRGPYGPPAARGWPRPGFSPYPPTGPNPAGYRSAVDGIWIGQAGEIVMVMHGHFRIYANAEVYRDGFYRIDRDRLIMFDPETETAIDYRYLLNDGRMIMRHANGSILLFKQLPIPIPPYSLAYQ
ncbi:MAG: hypothetical protein KZQ95_13595 [Candidatus Thiodiazotropha sp. (ex Epidulcina cf. delphinae)]|nr:hypothetical protein [Candidatus Thiodiazotropha sp. (ex Epidulcina cf. delphinae)]